MKLIRFLIIFIFCIATLLLAGLATKGAKGNPIDFQNGYDIRVGGPYEGSNSSSRYALTEAIAKYKTFFLNLDEAKFAAPDVVDYKGKFITIFTPGVSLIGVPFYMLGKMIGLPQLISYISMTLFGIINVFLIARLAHKFGAGLYASLISGFIYLFATNSLAYSITYTQHQLSVTLILLGLFNASGSRTFWKNIIFGLLIGLGLLVDLPNLILMAPIGSYILFKNFSRDVVGEKIKFSIKLGIVGLLIGLIPLAGLFAWYNYQTTGSYAKMGQTIGRTKLFRNNAPQGRSADMAENQNNNIYDIKIGLRLPFNSRSQLNGLYTLLISNERSWLYYSPVVLLGILGIYQALKAKNDKLQSLIVVALAVVLIDVVAYSMFGDPWGGWAFGPRYLIPAASIICSFLGVALQKNRRNIIFILIFLVLTGYSLYINAGGALTTNLIPPKVESVNLPQSIPYTYKYNFELLAANRNSSLIYNAYLSNKLPAKTFVLIYSCIGMFIVSLFLASLEIEKGKKES